LRSRLGRIPRAVDRQQLKRYVAVSAGRQDALKGKFERDCIARLRQLDALPRQCLGFTLQQDFGRQSGPVSPRNKHALSQIF
jgi:hypothetical protein